MARIASDSRLHASATGNGDAESGLEHDPEKWEPVFRKDHAQTKG
jgi:hypothetical protein